MLLIDKNAYQTLTPRDVAEMIRAHRERRAAQANAAKLGAKYASAWIDELKRMSLADRVRQISEVREQVSLLCALDANELILGAAEEDAA